MRTASMMAPSEIALRKAPPVLVASWSEVFATCEEQIRYERTRFVAELEKRWPVGTEISFWFNRLAKNCTIGTVTGHDGDGYVHVQLQTISRRGYPRMKRVHWKQIS